MTGRHTGSTGQGRRVARSRVGSWAQANGIDGRSLNAWRMNLPRGSGRARPAPPRGAVAALAVRSRAVQNLLDNELNGSNDPEVRAKMEFGKNEHKRIQADSGKCTVSEVTFGSRRVDCIFVSSGTCYVVEIKPNNDDAKRRGEKQIVDGIEEIEKELGGKKKKSELTGKLEVFRDCFDEASEKARLGRQLRVYEYCPPDGEMFKDFLVP